VQERSSPQVYIKKQASVTFTDIDPDRILEADLLRWLILMGPSLPELIQIAKWNLKSEHFKHPAGRGLYEKYMLAAQNGQPCDLLSLAIDLEQPEQQIFMAEVLQKKVNREKARECFVETVQKILERHWMYQREEIKLKIYSGKCSEEEVLDLARKFDLVKKERPQVVTKQDENS
jgi:DNA primase